MSHVHRTFDGKETSADKEDPSGGHFHTLPDGSRTTSTNDTPDHIHLTDNDESTSGPLRDRNKQGK